MSIDNTRPRLAGELSLCSIHSIHVWMSDNVNQMHRLFLSSHRDVKYMILHFVFFVILKRFYVFFVGGHYCEYSRTVWTADPSTNGSRSATIGGGHIVSPRDNLLNSITHP